MNQRQDDRTQDHSLGNEYDDLTGDGVEVVQGNAGLPVLLPKAARRLNPEQLAAFEDVQAVGVAYVRLDQDRSESVATARAVGVSWHLIGWSLGTSGPAARQRFGDLG